jgi:LCP family protein required for cell wall assembly
VYSGRPGPRRRWGRIGLVVAIALALFAGLLAGGGWLYYNRLNASLDRTDQFSQITGDRPDKAVKGALNMLLLGSDSRDPENKAKPGQWRTDTMIVLHVNAAHDKAYLVSIPRDLYVYIPKSKTNPKYGNTKAKINSAFAWGGLPLAVQAIEGYTGVRMDHVLLVDFGGFKQVTDALGGVDLFIEQDVTSIHPPKRHFTKGTHHLNGTEALDYVRQRYQFAEGDFARMRHQQQFMKALMDKAVSSGTLGNPAKLNAFLKSVTAAMTVDKDFSLVDTAVQFRSLRSENLAFMVSPHLGSQTIKGESVVAPDATKATALYQAMKGDTMDTLAAGGASPSATAKSPASR